MKYFNIAGPCNSADHYMIDAANRLPFMESSINDKLYFMIYAPRQSGKTTYLQALTQRLNAGGKYYALYCSLECVQGIATPEESIPAIIRIIQHNLDFTNIPHGSEFAKDADYKSFDSVLQISLTEFCKLLDRPLVILFDEVDCLSETTLLSFLLQLHDGYYYHSKKPFLHSVALVGMRDIVGWKLNTSTDNNIKWQFGKAFDMIKMRLVLQNFTKAEIALLYRQHTDETGQQFEDDVIEAVWEQTQGQPWLVNAIAREIVENILQSDYTKPVTTELVYAAIENLFIERPVHIDYLQENLQYEQVRRVITSLILGDIFINVGSNGFRYAQDLGLIQLNDHLKIQSASPFYADMIIRRLSSFVKNNLFHRDNKYAMPRYLKNGHVDVDFIMSDFQQFWNEKGREWAKKLDCWEASPVLTMTGFLQRVIHGCGRIIYEMATEIEGLNLCLIYEGQKYPIEIKLYDIDKYSKETFERIAGFIEDYCLDEGLRQTFLYMNKHRCSEGWLVIFDCRSTVASEDKLYMKKATVNGQPITVVGV